MTKSDQIGFAGGKRIVRKLEIMAIVGKVRVAQALAKDLTPER